MKNTKTEKLKKAKKPKPTRTYEPYQPNPLDESRITLALDLSSHVGYSVFKGTCLVTCGVIHVDLGNFSSYAFKIRTAKELPDTYPFDITQRTQALTESIKNLLKKHNCTDVVLEHPEITRHRLTYRFMEWLHRDVFEMLWVEGIKPKYLLVSDWRKDANCYISRWPEIQEHNKLVEKLKKKTPLTKSGAKRAIDESGKQLTKFDFKKLSIWLCKKYWGMDLKDDNAADACLIGAAFVGFKTQEAIKS